MEACRSSDLADAAAASPAARRSYEAHARLLREWGAAFNLTAIRDPAEVARRHVCDSLSAVHLLAARAPADAWLLDLGSGGGYPGLPLAAALSLGRVGLLDAVAKKARFLEVAAAAVRVELAVDDGAGPRIAAIAERAEDLAEEAGRAGRMGRRGRASGGLAGRGRRAGHAAAARGRAARGLEARG